MDVVGRHVKLSPRAKRLIEDDLARLFRSPALSGSSSSRTADRTAVAGLDYSPVSGILAFGLGERSKQVAVP